MRLPRRADDPRRPTPPAEIPTAPPLDLRAEAAGPPPAHTNVAEDMLSSVKSVFHAVLPKPSQDTRAYSVPIESERSLYSFV